MQHSETLPESLDETISEIASILAQGYLRYRRGRHLDSAVSGNRPYVAQPQESEAVTEKRLDSSGHRSLHS